MVETLLVPNVEVGGVGEVSICVKVCVCEAVWRVYEREGVGVQSQCACMWEGGGQSQCDTVRVRVECGRCMREGG